MVTGHGSVWQKISARPKVAAHGRKASSPTKFDMVFVWDEGHQQSFFSARDGKYLASSSQGVCADNHWAASDSYHASVSDFQAAGSSQALPTPTGLC